MLQPVRVIQATANRIRSDNLNERIPVGRSEGRDLALARFLNQMFDRLETSLPRYGVSPPTASHELKTPAFARRLHAERLLVMTTLVGTKGIGACSARGARAGQPDYRELLFLSRADARAVSVDMKEAGTGRLPAGVRAGRERAAEHMDDTFRTRNEGDGAVAFGEQRMRQVLLNLLSNAVSALPGWAASRFDPSSRGCLAHYRR